MVIAIYVWAMVSVHRNHKQMEHDGKPTETDYSDSNSSSGLDLSTKLMLGAMGAKLLDNQVEKHKRESEQRRKELFFWQDAIRDKERKESGYDQDDWL